MVIPEILKGEPHLPLTERMTLSEALPLVNAFYQTSFTMDEFHEAQAFQDSDGYWILEARSIEDGEVLIRFVNKTIKEISASQNARLINPLSVGSQWMGPLINVDSVSELAFLDELGSGNTYPTLCDNTLAWKLCTLLNEYNAVGHWRASTFSSYSTAGFELVYKGPSAEAPEEYLIGDSDMVAILRFHNGTHKGMLCLKS